MSDATREVTIQFLLRSMLPLSYLVMIGCDKNDSAPNQEKAPPIIPDATTTPERLPETPSTQAKPSASVNEYSCGSAEIWLNLHVKGLENGTIQSPVQGVRLPTPVWRPCDEQKYCQKLVLSENQRVLALGQHGNSLRLALAERCGESTSITIGAPDSAPTMALRGVDFEFETAVVSGDRFLLSGSVRNARAPGRAYSQGRARPPTGRDYLLTGREGQLDSLAAVRNVPQAIPLAVNHQLVRTGLPDETCTTRFWQFSLGKCDFTSPRDHNVALLGPNLIYSEKRVGMKWDAEDGASELLPALDWVMTDGVNVLWATGDVLSMTQPSYELRELQGRAVPGKAGPRPLALGCGRILSRDNGSFWLRNLEKGTRWLIPEARFPTLGRESMVMDCHSIIFQDGTRLLFKGLGEPEPVP